MLGTARRRHTAPITCVVAEPDGASFVAGDQAGRILRWDAASGRRLGDLGRTSDAIVAIEPWPAGGWLVADAGGRLYVTPDGLAPFMLGVAVRAMRIDRTGRRLTWVDANGILGVYDLSRRRVLQQRVTTARSMAYWMGRRLLDRDGRLDLSVERDRIRVVESSTGRSLWSRPRPATLRSAEWSDDRLILWVQHGDELERRSLEGPTGRLLQTTREPDPSPFPWEVIRAPGASWPSAVRSGGQALWRLMPRRGPFHPSLRRARVELSAMTPDGRALAVAEGHTLHLAPRRPPVDHGFVEGHRWPVSALAFAGRDRLVSVAPDGQVLDWRTSTGMGQRPGWFASPPTDVAIRPDGRLAVLDRRGQLHLQRDVEAGWVVRDSGIWRPGTSWRPRLVHRSGGAELGVADPMTGAIVWCTRAGLSRQYLGWRSWFRHPPVIAGDVAICHRFGQLLIGELDAFAPRISIDLPSPDPSASSDDRAVPPALAADRRRLAIAWNHTVQVRSVATGSLIWSTPGRAAHLAFSPDGQTLAVARVDGPIAVHSSDDGRVLRRLDGTGASCLAFSADGTRLGAGLADTRIGVWQLDR